MNNIYIYISRGLGQEARECVNTLAFLHPHINRYRFAEIRYHRPEEMHKGRLVPARVETVVIFLPDVWSCSPSRLEWETLQSAYKKQLQDKIAAENKDDSQASASFTSFT